MKVGSSRAVFGRLPRMLAVVAVAGALSGVAAAGDAAAQPPDPQTLQTIGLVYSGFECPSNYLHAVSDVQTTLTIRTVTNFSSAAVFEIPALHVRVPLPTAFGAVDQAVSLGRLRPGSIAFRFVAPPVTGSYGGSCPGTITVTPLASVP